MRLLDRCDHYPNYTFEPHPRADGPQKLPGQLRASIPFLPALYRDLCMSLDDADFFYSYPSVAPYAKAQHIESSRML